MSLTESETMEYCRSNDVGPAVSTVFKWLVIYIFQKPCRKCNYPETNIPLGGKKNLKESQSLRNEMKYRQGENENT